MIRKGFVHRFLRRFQNIRIGKSNVQCPICRTNFFLPTINCSWSSNSLRLMKFLVLGSLFFTITATAQVFPVQVSHNLVPPYSSKIGDYATGLGTKLQLRLLLTDIGESNRQVGLRLNINGNGINVRSAQVVVGAPAIFLNGGVLQQFTNVELAPYFELANLVGIGPREYARPLPDGVYRICWEVYDHFTGRPISRNSCTTAYLLLNDPPLPNIPVRGERVADRGIPNIIFQWTPRHVNAINVSYEFELRELWDDGMDPQAAFLASPNYHSETTFATTLHYAIGRPVLYPGRTYGWRVRVVSTTGLAENAVFKNNGHSEIYHFTMARDCDPPLFPLSEARGPKSVKITWQDSPDHGAYHLQYRRTGVEGAHWFEVHTKNDRATLQGLSPGAEYEFRIGGSCDPPTELAPAYTYGSITRFTMPTEEGAAGYNCGFVPRVEITDTEPLDHIGVNEVFTAGDFPVTVKEVTMDNGRFTGWGYIIVPYLADTRLRVSFKNIRINTEGQLIAGKVTTDYDPQWENVESVEGFVQDIASFLEALAGIFKEREEKLKELGEVPPSDYQKYAPAIIADLNALSNRLNGNQSLLIGSPYATEEQKKELEDLKLSQYYVDNKIDIAKERKNQKTIETRILAIGEEIERAEDEGFTANALEILRKDPFYESTLEKLRALNAYLKETAQLCKEEGWGSYKDQGVVPHCLWKNAGIDRFFYYSAADIPYMSGLMDGIYSQVEGVVLLPKMLYDLANGAGEVVFAYTADLLACHPQLLRLNQKRLGMLLTRLEEEDKGEGPWSWAKEQWDRLEVYKAESYAERCEGAEQLRGELDGLLEYLSERENIKELFQSLEKKVKEYLGTLVGTDNTARYLHGKMVIFVGSSMVPVAGQLSKVARVKQVLQAIQKFTKGQWDEFLRKLDQRLVRGINNAGVRFIAKSGVELKTFLNGITDLPAGVTYKGKMYRSIGNQYNNPLEIHLGAVSSNYRYSRPGEGGLYLSKTRSGNVTEISHYGDISTYKTYEYSNVQIDNMLDLTDDVVRQQLGVDFDLLTRSQSTGDDFVDATFNYGLTHEIGTWAVNKSYKGIIVPGARGSKNYVNIVIFKQSDVDASLISITPNIINN